MHRKFPLVLATLGAALLFLVSSPATAQISLGAGQSFGVLGSSTVTNTGPTVVNGNIGLTPGSSVTGFPPGTIVDGVLNINNTEATTARTDINTAFTDINALPCSVTFGAGTDITTLSPIDGAATPVLCFTSSALITGPVTISGAAGDQVVFKIGSTLTVSNNAVVTDAGGITCDRVLWAVGSSATIGTNSSFFGDILALASVTLNTGAAIAGRALALNGAVTLDTNNVSPCGLSPLAPSVGVAAIPTLSEWGLIILSALMMLFGLHVSRRRLNGAA